jgi:cyclic-di-GMP phosphodiesterase TipF (flagellum assembly factor)
MRRLGAIFVATCMVLIAAAAGAVLYLAIGVAAAESILAALLVLCTLAIYNIVIRRWRDHVNIGAQIANLSRGTSDLAIRVGELGQRVANIESLYGPANWPLEDTPSLAVEVAELGFLVRELAESVAAHEARLAHAALSAAVALPLESDITDATNEPAPPPAHQDRLDRDRLVAEIRSAIDANRVDLYLQPIVSLPQRKVRYYEALTRLRTEDGRMIEPSEFIEAAEAAGLIARLDHMMLQRCVQVLRRLQLKNRDTGLFCNLSAVTLNDPQFFPQMTQFMDANRVLAPSLLIEFKQSAWRGMGPLELESLAALRQAGFHFGMDQVTDLTVEPRELSARGIRFIKAPGGLLLGRTGAIGADIHVEDLAGLLRRFAVNLVADRIESETDVVDLLDFNIRFGQGFVFSPPRPVRAEALQGVPDFQDTEPKRPEAPAAPPAAAAI